MTYRKTWFDYVLWAAYTGVCVMLLSYTGYQIYADYVALPLAKLGALLIFPILVCVYLGLRLSCRAIRKKYSFSQHGIVMLEALFVSVSFVFGLLLRLRVVLYAEPRTDWGDFFDRALIRAEKVEPLAHGLSQLYVYCLSSVFSFLGNSPYAAMLLQAVLQLAAMALGFLAVKKAAGRLASWVVLLLMAFASPFLQKIGDITPECLYLVLYLLGLLAVLGFVRANLQGKRISGGLAGAMCVGALVGVLLYVDLTSLSLLLFLIGLFVGKRERKDKVSGRILRLCVAVLYCAAFFLAVVGIDAAVSDVRFGRALEVWAYPYLTMQGRPFLSVVISGHYLFWGLLFVAAAFLVFAFLRSGKEQDHSLWLLACVLFTPAFLADFSVTGCGVLFFFFWSVMAGLGVKNCVLDRQAEIVRARIEEINAAANPVPEAVLRTVMETSQIPQERQTEGKPRFLENPLPVPKRHVPREMDYDYEVKEDKLHFDIEIAAGDDFDLV